MKVLRAGSLELEAVLITKKPRPLIVSINQITYKLF